MQSIAHRGGVTSRQPVALFFRAASIGIFIAAFSSGCVGGVSAQRDIAPSAPIDAASSATCVVSGCNNQVCDTQPRLSTCDHRPEYRCRVHSPCEVQPDGQCGFTETEAYQRCISQLRVDIPGPRTFATMPGPEVITDATCADVTWLLTHYRLERLASGNAPAKDSGYPLACCEPGVLSDENSYRCELDWPSSDVVHCDLWRHYHFALSAAHPQGSRSERVESNLGLLSAWAENETNCSSR